MSRLDSFIRRLEAQRACIDRAAELIGDLPGPVLELGLGNGRTYDHLRERLPGRAIYVFDREIASNPRSTPPPSMVLLGDLRETLAAAAARLGGEAALAHMDIATHDPESSRALAQSLAPALARLMRAGGIVVCEPPLAVDGWEALPAPEEAQRYAYHLYRAAGR